MGSGLSCYLKPSTTAAAPRKEDQSADAAPGERVQSAVSVINTNEDWGTHWDAHKNSKKLMVIYFSASWCGPCRFIEPIFKSLAAKYTDVIFVKIDVDDLSAVAEQWKVQAIPTFVMVKGGKELGRIVGAGREELESKILKFRC